MTYSFENLKQCILQSNCIILWKTISKHQTGFQKVFYAKYYYLEGTLEKIRKYLNQVDEYVPLLTDLSKVFDSLQ